MFFVSQRFYCLPCLIANRELIFININFPCMKGRSKTSDGTEKRSTTERNSRLVERYDETGNESQPLTGNLLKLQFSYKVKSTAFHTVKVVNIPCLL